MKIVDYGLVQRVEIFDIILKPKFKVGPTVFNTVFVRRINGQPNNSKSIKIGDFFKDRLSVPRNVVHEDDAVASQ